MRLPSNCPLFYVPGFGITYVVAEKIKKIKKTKTCGSFLKDVLDTNCTIFLRKKYAEAQLHWFWVFFYT